MLMMLKYYFKLSLEIYYLYYLNIQYLFIAKSGILKNVLQSEYDYYDFADDYRDQNYTDKAISKMYKEQKSRIENINSVTENLDVKSSEIEYRKKSRY